MEYIKQSMNNIWAAAGDVVMPEEVKIAEGWLVEVPPRQYWNWMQNRTDVNLAYIFQRGVPEWDISVEYLANKSFVVYNGVIYKCILTGVGKNPESQPTYWVRAFRDWSAIGQAVDNLTPDADRFVYYTGANTAALGIVTSFARSILDDTSAAAVRTTIGAQASDATLTALAGVTTATNKLIYFTGVDTADATDLSAFGRSLIDDADASAARTTLGLGTAAVGTLTESTTDDIVGKVLKVGDFGIGSNAVQISGDFNTVVRTGFYIVVSPVNGPSGSTTNLLVLGNTSGSGRTMQIAQPVNSETYYVRSQSTGTWSTWRQFYHSGNLLNIGTTAATARTALGLDNVTNTSDATKSIGGNAATATKLQTARTINGTPFDGTTNITVADSTKLPLTGGTMTGDIVFQNISTGGWARGLLARIQSSGALVGGIGFLGTGDSVSSVYLGIGPTFWSSGNGVRVTAGGVTISGATTFDTLISGSVNGNAATATKLATARNIAITGAANGSAAFDGSGNVSIVTTTPRVNPAADPTSTFRADVFGGVDDKIKVLRSGVSGILNFPQYSPCLAWSTSDTHAFFSPTYSSPRIRVGAGSGTGIIWEKDLAFTDSDITGNAATATKLAAGRTIGMTGDVTWTSPAFDGSDNVTAAATLANTGVTAGTYTKVTVNVKGLVTAGAALAAADIPDLDTSKLTSGTLPIAQGGTGGATAAAARTALGIGSMATRNVTISTANPSGGVDGDIWFKV